MDDKKGKKIMTDLEETIHEFEQFIDNDYKNYTVPPNNAIDLALQVLQEKLEREQGCEYCNTVEQVNGHYRIFYKAFPHHNDDKIFTSLDFADLSIAHDNKNGWVLHFEDDNGDRMFDVKINYCPNCGRKLKEDK